MSRFVQRPGGSKPGIRPARRPVVLPPPVKLPRPGPSVYAERFPASATTRTVNVAGFQVEMPVCCENPAVCRRPECWERIGDLAA
jgi:hypothetical protein